MPEITLTPRLEKIADLIKPGSRIADIGTDHAHLPIYLMQKGKISFAAACDINKGPLLQAEKNIKACGLEEVISLRLGGGFDKVSDMEADTAVIAGMGGELIADILKKIPGGISHLLLQPMTMLPQCRMGIHSAGFEIEKEYFVKEKDKIYVIISAVPETKKQVWNSMQYELPPVAEDGVLKDEYISRYMNKLKKLSDTLRKSGKTYLAEKAEEKIKWIEKNC